MLAWLFINKIECFGWLVICHSPFEQTCHLKRRKMLPGLGSLRNTAFAFPLYIDTSACNCFWGDFSYHLLFINESIYNECLRCFCWCVYKYTPHLMSTSRDGTTCVVHPSIKIWCCQVLIIWVWNFWLLVSGSDAACQMHPDVYQVHVLFPSRTSVSTVTWQQVTWRLRYQDLLWVVNGVSFMTWGEGIQPQRILTWTGHLCLWPICVWPVPEKL